MRTAPVLVTVWTSEEAYLDRYAEPDKGWTDRDPARWSAPYWFVDAGMASMAALLSAVDNDLGACFFGIPADRIAAVREAFGVPRVPAERRCDQPRVSGSSARHRIANSPSTEGPIRGHSPRHLVGPRRFGSQIST